MTRPKGSVNRPKYEQGQLPDEYLPKESTDFTQIRINKNLESYGGNKNERNETCSSDC